MNTRLQALLILSMIFLCTTTFSQTNVVTPQKLKNSTTGEKTYLSLLLSMVNTNLNYGKSNGAFADNKKSMQGIQFGASFQGGITPEFSMVSELYFIMKGGKLTENRILNIDQTKLRLYTIELPVLARYDFGKVYLNAGPSVAYTLSGSRKIADISKDLSFNSSNEGFKRLDAGVQLGTGYRFKVKQKPVALDIRYSYGLTDISRGEEIHNRYLNVGLYFTKLWKTNPLGRGSVSRKGITQD